MFPRFPFLVLVVILWQSPVADAQSPTPVWQDDSPYFGTPFGNIGAAANGNNASAFGTGMTATQLGISGGSFTFTGWFLRPLDAPTTGDQAVFGSATGALGLMCRNNMLYSSINNGTATCGGNVQWPGAGLWDHVAFVFNAPSRTQSIFLDGTLVASCQAAANLSSSHEIQVGTYNGGNTWYGSMQYLKIFNTALTPSQLSVVAGGPSSNPIQTCSFGFTCPSGQTAVSNSANAVMGAAGENCCITTSSELVVENGGFDTGCTSETCTTVSQEALQGWTSAGSTYYVSAGESSWGGKVTADGSLNYAALQNAGTSITQAVSGHASGQQYLLSFSAMSRPGFVAATSLGTATMRVSINSQALWVKNLPMDGLWVTYSVLYTSGGPTVSISFSNTSPAGQDLSFLLDNVRIYTMVPTTRTTTTVTTATTSTVTTRTTVTQTSTTTTVTSTRTTTTTVSTTATSTTTTATGTSTTVTSTRTTTTTVTTTVTTVTATNTATSTTVTVTATSTTVTTTVTSTTVTATVTTTTVSTTATSTTTTAIGTSTTVTSTRTTTTTVSTTVTSTTTTATGTSTTVTTTVSSTTVTTTVTSTATATGTTTTVTAIVTSTVTSTATVTSTTTTATTSTATATGTSTTATATGTTTTGTATGTSTTVTTTVTSTTATATGTVTGTATTVTATATSTTATTTTTSSTVSSSTATTSVTSTVTGTGTTTTVTITVTSTTVTATGTTSTATVTTTTATVTGTGTSSTTTATTSTTASITTTQTVTSTTSTLTSTTTSATETTTVTTSPVPRKSTSLPMTTTSANLTSTSTPSETSTGTTTTTTTSTFTKTSTTTTRTRTTSTSGTETSTTSSSSTTATSTTDTPTQTTFSGQVATETSTITATSTTSTTTPQVWRLLAKQDVDKCRFSPSANTTLLENPTNFSADCYMVLGWQDWSNLRRPDGTFVFRATWLLRDGTLLDLSWRQLSVPTAGTIKGFMPLSHNASEAALFSDAGFGPECTSFRGLGLSSEPDTCVLDGSGGDACHFSCIGSITPYMDLSTSPGRPSIPGPFSLLTRAFTLWVMQDSAPPMQASATPVQEVSANMTLEVENPDSFAADPAMKWAIVLTFSQELAVPTDWISITLDLVPGSRLLLQGPGRELQLAPLVRVGLTVAVQSAIPTKSNATESPPATAVQRNIQVLNLNQVSSGISKNAQQTTGAPVAVKVQQISQPQVSTRSSGSFGSSTTPSAGQDQGGGGSVGVIRKSGSSAQKSVVFAAVGLLLHSLL